jgi:hypothetical protein
MPAKIKATVPHQSSEQAISAGKFHIVSSRVETIVKKARQLPGNVQISRYQSGISVRNGTTISFFEPVRIFGLQQTTGIAKEVPDFVFVEDAGLKDLSPFARTYWTLRQRRRRAG